MTVGTTKVPEPPRQSARTVSQPARVRFFWSEWLAHELSRVMDDWGRTLRATVLVLLAVGCTVLLVAVTGLDLGALVGR